MDISACTFNAGRGAKGSALYLQVHAAASRVVKFVGS